MRSSPSRLPSTEIRGVARRAYSPAPALLDVARLRKAARRTSVSTWSVHRAWIPWRFRRSIDEIAACALFEIRRKRSRHRIAGDENVEQRRAVLALHVHRCYYDLIERGLILHESDGLSWKARRGGTHDGKIGQACGASERSNDCALRISDQEDRIIVGYFCPQLSCGVANGGLISGAEGRPNIRHVADDETDRRKHVRPRSPKRLVCVEAGPHFVFQALGCCSHCITQHEPACQTEEQRDCRRCDDERFGQQGQARKSGAFHFFAPG